jgi:hypothetical protein
MSKLVIYIICLAIVLVIGITFFVKKYLNRKKREAMFVPEKVLKEFNLAEKMLKDSKGNKTPYEILFDIARNHLVEEEDKQNQENLKGGLNGTRTESDTGADNRNVAQAEPTASISGDEGRGNIQSGIDSGDSVDSSQPQPVARVSKVSSSKPFSRLFRR